MSNGAIDAVIVGCNRMTANGDFANKIGTANGDFANKIGTLGVAILAREFGVPFYIAVPTSFIDASLLDGVGIPIEERGADAARRVGGSVIASEVAIFNPAFDVTPHRYLTAIITEYGVIEPPFEERLRHT